MSGYYAVLLAVQLCESIDLYGFEAYMGEPGHPTKYHYFDEVQGVTTAHSFDFAIEVSDLCTAIAMPF